MDREAEFHANARRLFGLAYRMLGTRADAEDIVQETYLRWFAAAEQEIQSPTAYLTTITTRLALDHLKSARQKRESYIGPWLPEPILAPAGTSALERAESLSMAFLVVLETLTPLERAAFLLRQIFETDYEEVARTLETSEANARQLVRRARLHLDEHRSRFRADPERHRQVVAEFRAACETGDAQRLAALLTEGVVHYADGGGKSPAALRPITGRDAVARLWTGLSRKLKDMGGELEWIDINSELGLARRLGATLNAITAFDVDAEGRIQGIFVIVNPDKLIQAGPERELQRP